MPLPSGTSTSGNRDEDTLPKVSSQYSDIDEDLELEMERERGYELQQQAAGNRANFNPADPNTPVNPTYLSSQVQQATSTPLISTVRPVGATPRGDLGMSQRPTVIPSSGNIAPGTPAISRGRTIPRTPMSSTNMEAVNGVTPLRRTEVHASAPAFNAVHWQSPRSHAQQQDSHYATNAVIWGTTVNVEEAMSTFRDFLREYAVDGEPHYLRVLHQIRESEVMNINIDLENLREFSERCRTFYKQLIYYPQEIIPLMDLVVDGEYKRIFDQDALDEVGRRIQVRPTIWER